MKKQALLFSILICSIYSVQLIAQNYQSAESTEYDPINKQWLTSNGSTIIADDGHGNLSFFGNAVGSHGLEVVDTVLFAIANSVIRAYNLYTADEIGSITIPTTFFLNGITSDNESNLYVTDFSTKKIYRVDISDLQNMTYEEIVSNTVTTPNGIIHDGDNNRLIFVSWGNNAPIKAVDLSNYQVSTILTTNLGNIDGIDDDNDGNYYISSWSPDRITKYDPGFANLPETITTPAISNPADIGYSKETDTLGIPIGSDVVFVGFESDTTVNVLNLTDQPLHFSISPNPVTDQSFVQFELKKNQTINLQVIDNHGRIVKKLLSGEQPLGKHKVLLAGLDLPPGIYYLHLQSKRETASQKMIVP